MKLVISFIACLLCSSCGYHYTAYEGAYSGGGPSISIPYIHGDPEAILNNELAFALASSGEFKVEQSGGDLCLEVALISDTNDRVGFRYDRDNPDGHLERNLLGVENRRTIIAEVTLTKSSTGKKIVSAETVTASVVYDYTDPGSPRDLLFSEVDPIIQFSLGQLDSFEGALDDSSRSIFRQLSQKIAMGLIGYLPEIASN
jgi:hypothetical protein